MELGDFIAARRKDCKPETTCVGVLVGSSAQGLTVAIAGADGRLEAIALCCRRDSEIVAPRPARHPHDYRAGQEDVLALDAPTRSFVELARAALDVVAYFDDDFGKAFLALQAEGTAYLALRDRLLRTPKPRRKNVPKGGDAMSRRLPGCFGFGKRR